VNPSEKKNLLRFFFALAKDGNGEEEP